MSIQFITKLLGTQNSFISVSDADQLASKRFVNIAPKQTLTDCTTQEEAPKRNKTRATTSTNVSSKSKSIVKPKNNEKLPASKTALITEGVNQMKEKKAIKVRKPKKEPQRIEPEVPDKTDALPTLTTPKDQIVEEKQSSSTPHSASHVRALDFSTPPRLFSPKKPNAAATPKNLFETYENEDKPENSESGTKTIKPIKLTLDSWDSDLRILVESRNDIMRSSSKKKAKPKGKSKVKKKEEKVAALNSTCEDGKLIEQALLSMTPQRIDTNGENADAQAAKEKDGKPLPDVEANCVQNSSKNEMSNAELANENPQDVALTNMSPPKSSIKKKCNVDSSIKRDVCITKIKEIKLLEFVDDTSNKLILSPSKLNASKRTLIEVVDALAAPKTTPENARTAAEMPMSSAKRNVTPLLETPIKLDVCPKTPGFFSPVNTTDTPLTRVLKEQLQGVDISTIPTPKFPVTPKFPFTPGIEDFCYPNRPTDYSSSSSYYLPSDTESKSLEQILSEETRRLENIPPTPAKMEVEKVSGEEKVHILNEIRIPAEVVQDPEQLHETNKAIADKMKTMGNNVIGRKNLSLVKSVDQNSSSSSSSSEGSSSSSSTGESDDSWTAEGNNTVLPKPPSSVRSLRSRKTEVKSNNMENNKQQSITEIISKVEIKKTLDPQKSHNAMDFRESVLAEMEEKKKRTIEIFQNESRTSTSGKPKAERSRRSRGKVNKHKPLRDQFGKFIPRSASKTQNSKGTQNAVNEEIKNNKQTPTRATKKEDAANEIAMEYQVLHLSSDDEDLQPFEMVETELRETSTSSVADERKGTSLDISRFQKALDLAKSKQPEKKLEVAAEDSRAENLVKELKEWGIHLIHKKSPMDQEKLERRRKEIGTRKKETSKDRKEKKEPVEKKLDASLEEGEILSDLEVEKASRNEPRKLKGQRRKTTVTKDSINSKPTASTRKQTSPGKSKKITGSKTRKEPSPTKKNEDGNSKSKQDEPEVVFDHKVYANETIKWVHDSSRSSLKKLSDYNFNLLAKKIYANVYIEELDADVRKSITVTPFEFLLDIPPSKAGSNPGKSKSDPSKSTRRMRPLALLSKELEDESAPEASCVTASPLDELYSSEKTSYTKKLAEKQRERTTKSPRSPAKGKSKNALGAEEKHLADKKTRRISTRRSSEKLTDKESSKSSEKQERIGEESVEDACRSGTIVEEVCSKKESAVPIEKLDVIDGVIMLNATPNERASGENDDDLMNYAVVGTPDKM